MPNDNRPNILMIMADQLGPFLTGAYGHPIVKTPNLDRLVREGIRFDTAYSPYPLCAPARACMMTGRYASRIRCVDNASPLACDEPTFAHYLSLAGYDSVLSGKMHFVGPDQLHGFRTRLTTDIYPSDFKWVTSRQGQGKPMFPDHPHALMYATPKIGLAKWSMYLDYDEETQMRAIQYLYSRRITTGDANADPRTSGNTNISASEDERQPFFLCVSYHHPHEPFIVTKDLWDMYEGERIDIPEVPPNLKATYSMQDKWLNIFHGVDWVNHLMDPKSLYVLRRAYYGLVSYIDAKVGELLGALEKAGLKDNTIVIFTSDHGDMLCEKGMVQKRTFYEWSTRVPLIVSFPDERSQGTKVKQPVSLIDLAPTLLDMAEVRAENRLPMDGKSVMGLMDGSDSQAREVFSEYHSEGVYATCFMIRSGKYKYNYVHGHGAQLFDLENDPNEWQNLSGQPEFKELEDALRAQILTTFDPDEIERDVLTSLPKQNLIRAAMKKNDTHWDYTPIFDGAKQYVR
ncbi:MAG: choline-sulfatase [Chloroflexi bacterium]|nr:choline-sulfatase [Chloroflexota bacterium]